MIETASFMIPSPNMILNRFGYSFLLSSETAATTSEEQRREHIKSISVLVRFKILHSSFTKLYYSSSCLLFTKQVMRLNITNAQRVEKIPRVRIIFMFAKKFPRSMLNPLAKIIGGKHR